MIQSAAVLFILLAMIVVASSVGCDEKPSKTVDHVHNAEASTMADGFGSPFVPPLNADASRPGLSESSGMTIYWSSDRGADPLDVINATITRLQYEQTTDDLASDTNARVIAHLMLARQELEGKKTTTDDGIPILE